MSPDKSPQFTNPNEIYKPPKNVIEKILLGSKVKKIL